MFATNVVCFMYLGHTFPTTNRRDFGHEFTVCKFPNPPQIHCTLTPIYVWMYFQYCLLHAQRCVRSCCEFRSVYTIEFWQCLRRMLCACVCLGHASPTTIRRDFGHEFTGRKFPNPPPNSLFTYPNLCLNVFQCSGTCERLWLLFHWFCSLCVRCVCAWFDLNVCVTLDVSSWHIYFLDS